MELRWGLLIDYIEYSSFDFVKNIESTKLDVAEIFSARKNGILFKRVRLIPVRKWSGTKK